MTRRRILKTIFAAPSFLLAQRPSQVQKVHGGFHSTDGPICNKNGDLYFSDVAEERIYCLSKGELRVIRNSSNLANGLAFDRQGRLVVCERGRITRSEVDGKLTIVADNFAGKGLHWPNDLVVRSDGSIFFTDLKQKNEWANPAKTGFNAVYRWSPDRKLTLVSRDCQAPNGIALSPKEDLLYVCDTTERAVWVYELDAEGARNRRSFVKTSEKGGPDGMKIDSSGNVWICEDEGIKVFSPRAEHLRTIPVPETPSNCVFSNDGCTLFVTARTSIYSLDGLGKC